jgi:hypothetical protein
MNPPPQLQRELQRFSRIHNNYYTEAAIAAQRGDDKTALLNYRTLISETGGTKYPFRWYSFKGYVSLIDQGAVAHMQELNFLKQIKTNKKEPLIFRINACFGLGRHFFNVHDRAGAARAYKAGIELIDGASKKDLDVEYWHSSMPLIKGAHIEIALVSTRDILTLPASDGQILGELFKRNLKWEI